MLKIDYTARFRKDYKKIRQQSFFDEELFNKVITTLAKEEPLEPKYCDHALEGKYVDHRECHIKPDWLLIYKVEKDVLTLTLTRTGSHSNLF